MSRSNPAPHKAKDWIWVLRSSGAFTILGTLQGGASQQRLSCRRPLSDGEKLVVAVMVVGVVPVRRSRRSSGSRLPRALLSLPSWLSLRLDAKSDSAVAKLGGRGPMKITHLAL